MPRSSGGGWRQIGLQGSVKSVSRGEASLLGWPVPPFTEKYSRHTYPNYSLTVAAAQDGQVGLFFSCTDFEDNAAGGTRAAPGELDDPFGERNGSKDVSKEEMLF